jgi:release factor glutamine methyltransferase
MASQKPISVRELLQTGAEQLQEISTTPRLDAELLLGRQLNWSRTHVITESRHEVNGDDQKGYWELISRRASYEPVAYILGVVEFWNSQFIVTPDVLIPRPETEHLVEFALARLKGNKQPSLLDLGTGSGCIALSIVDELVRKGINVQAHAVDISSEALQVARQNADKLGLADKITFLQSNWYDAVPKQQFDCILSNPPYIATDDTEVSPDIVFEPSCALYSEKGGLSDIETIIRSSADFMKSEASLFIETGYRQHKEIEEFLSSERYFADLYRDYQFHRDMAGLDRIVELVRG